MGRLGYSKGVFEIPDIVKHVKRELPEVTCVVVGGGTNEFVEKLKTRIKNKQVDENITLVGQVSEEEKYMYMKNADVFLTTSHEEGWGISVAEAMACELPVVAYDLPVFKEIFTKGMICAEMCDTKQMGKNIVELLRNPKKRKEMGEEARDFIFNNYTWDKAAVSELAIIRKIDQIKKIE